MKLVSPEEQLKARLNQPYATRLEVLRQFKETTPLSPNAEKELEELERLEREKVKAGRSA